MGILDGVQINQGSDYSDVLKDLNEESHNLDYKTDLEMKDIKVLIQDFFVTQIELNRNAVIFSEELKNEAEELFEKKQMQLAYCRLKQVDIIWQQTLEVYKKLKISYKRKSREEIVMTVKKYINQQEEARQFEEQQRN